MLVKKLRAIRHYKAVGFLKKELKKMTPESAHKRIAVFYDEYNKQYPIIIQKMEMAKQLGHEENYKRIKAFHDDMEELRIRMDDFVLNIEEDKKKDKSLQGKLKRTRMGRFALLMRALNRANIRYGKEDCDIANFKV